MNRKRWQDGDGHPPEDVLLLHREGELDGRAAGAVRAHVEQCEACRLICGELEMGLARFDAFRQSAVVPERAPNVNALRARLAQAEAAAAGVSLIARFASLLRVHSPRRLAFAGAGVSLCLIVWLALFLSSPRQSVYASQILDSARSASDSLISGAKVLDQRIRLRSGSLVIERSIHRGRHAAVQAKESRIGPQLQQELDLAHIDLDDPLSARDYALWRAGQPHTDSVSENSQSVTITTRVTGSAITEGTLTLSRSGWRPIARSVELRGESPIEISELSYDIRDSSSPAADSAIGALAPGEASGAASAAVAGDVSSSDLEASELDLREVLHSLGADVSANPEIWRSGDEVLFHASAARPAEMAEIRAAASRIPHVAESGKAPAGAAEPPQPADVRGPYSVDSPLAAALEARLGGAEAERGLVDSLPARSSRVLAEASALDQLGKRYTAETVKRLPPGLRVRVNRLAAGMLSNLQRDSGEYVKSLAPALDDMAREANLPATQDDGADLPSCLPWQQNAALAAPHLRDFARDVSRLLAPDADAAPGPSAAQSALSDSLRAKSFLQLHLMSTCQLFGPN